MTPFKNAYPQDIKPLTPLRFAAAVWVLLYFFGDRMGLAWRDASGFIAKGYMGVDLFFILSGFILAHVYGPQWIAGKFSYGSFLWARLARLYPVHLVTLGALVLVAIGAKTAGMEVSGAFDFSVLWGQLLMVQAWGFVPAGGWNHPAWSISAEWFAYLIFPLSFGLVAFFKARPLLAVLASAALFVGLWYGVPLISAFGGADLTELTANGGALRIIPSFLMGVSLWRLGQAWTIPARWSWSLVLWGALWVFGFSSLRAPDWITWLGLAAIIFALAETAKHTNAGPLTSPRAIWLGEVSYALYMVHMPVDLVWFQATGRFVQVAPGSPSALGLVVGAVAISMLGAAILYDYVERPARSWLRQRDPFKPKPVPLNTDEEKPS